MSICRSAQLSPLRRRAAAPIQPSLGLWRDNDTVSAQARRLSRSSPATESLVATSLAKPMNGINAPKRPDCVAGHVRLELRNVVAKYPFERSHRLLESGRILATETIRV
jgi:hypothetical protein